MERKLWHISYLLMAAWFFSSFSLVIAALLCIAAAALAALYGQKMVQTLKAVDLKPIVWGFVSDLIVLKDLSYDDFFGVDGAPADLQARRRKALEDMSKVWKQRWPKTHAATVEMKKLFSDLRFKASGFESIFPIFQKVVNEALDMCTIADRTEGTEVVDVDGFRLLDSSGSYGVNCFGHTRFKQFMDDGNKLAQQVGPLLGPMHPVVTENCQMLLKIFRKQEVSFHMSGTEAIMTAVQQVRFHTGRPLIAVFKGAYHGWWDGVMQGAGNPRFNFDCIVLKDKNPASLELLRARSSEIAGVIVNPIAGMGWGPSTTAELVTGGKKFTAGEQSIEKFREWLKQLRETCTASSIPLIYDETWAFQLGPGGAQDLYGVEADIVTLGKALGGGHAVGAVVGPQNLMERRDPERPMRVSFVVGTFKGSPMVMGSMNAVLKWVSSPDGKSEFNGMKDRVDKWMASCNTRLQKEGLPISVCAYRNMWCVSYQQSSAYNFLFPCYLRDAGLQMVWVGTGKMLLNLEFSSADLERITSMLVSCGKRFKEDGWWWEGAQPISLPKLVLGPTFQFHKDRVIRWVNSSLGSK